MDIEFYNSFNNLFSSQDEFNRIYRMVENDEHRQHPRLRNLRLEDGLLFYKDRKNKFRVVSKLEIPNFLEDIYSKIETFGLGINKMHDVIKELFIGITRKDLVEFLKDKPKFQLNQPLYKVGRNNPIITRRSNFLFQADHMHLSSFPNQRYKYVFIFYFSQIVSSKTLDIIYFYKFLRLFTHLHYSKRYEDICSIKKKHGVAMP